MYALEEEPEKQGRWRRMGGGALVAVFLACGMSYAATEFEPARRMLQKVVKLTVQVQVQEPPPPPKELPPLPPPPKRPQPKQKAMAPQPKQAAIKPRSNDPQQVGLDSESFAEGSGGPAFGAGNTQMGAPPTVYQPPVVKKAPPEPPRALAFREAKPRGTIPAIYTDRARRLGVQGLMVLEVDIDPRGQVTHVRLRRGLERGLDEEALRAVRRISFEPATRGGSAVPSTRFLRIKYQLQG